MRSSQKNAFTEIKIGSKNTRLIILAKSNKLSGKSSRKYNMVNQVRIKFIGSYAKPKRIFHPNIKSKSLKILKIDDSGCETNHFDSFQSNY